MVLKLIEKDYPLDEVIFFDTGMEFQAIYNNIEKLSKILLDKKLNFQFLKTSILLNSTHFSEKFTKKMEQQNMVMIGAEE